MISYFDAERGTCQEIVRKFGRKAEARLLLPPEGYTVAAEERGVLLGFLSCCPREMPEPLQSMQDAYIAILEVEGKHRRRGIASAMLERAEAWARANRHDQMRAWSSSEKTAALSFWRARGYCLCPAEEWDGQRAIPGFYAVKKLIV